MSDRIDPPILPPRFPRIIYLNGPAGTGKTSLANYLCSFDGVTQHHHATPLYDMANLFHEYLHPDSAELDFDDPEIKRKSLTSHLESATWRDFLIHQGNYLREVFGPCVLSELVAASVVSSLGLGNYDTVVLPSTRTKEDLESVVRIVPSASQILIRLKRNGTSWKGDIGEYLFPDNIPSIVVTNNGTLEELYTSIFHLIGE